MNLHSTLNTSPRNSNNKQITIDSPMNVQILTDNLKGTQLLRNSNTNTNSNITLFQIQMQQQLHSNPNTNFKCNNYPPTAIAIPECHSFLQT